MPDPKGVIFALAAVGEGADAVAAADAGHPVFAPRQDLMGIGLMPHVPDQFVGRGVEHVMQGHGQLHRAQSRRKMPAGHAHRLGQELPQLFRQGLEQFPRQLAHVGGAVDVV